MKTKRRTVLPAELDAAATLLDRHSVAARLEVTTWTLGQWVASGRFPKPDLRITDSAHRWRLSTVLKWMADIEREPRRAPRLKGKAAYWHAPRPPTRRVRL